MTAIAYRTAEGRRPDPPPPTELPDQLDLTARQVRLDGRNDSPVHRLRGRWVDRQYGVMYRTECDHVMTGTQGAILTTRDTDCGRCLGGGR